MWRESGPCTASAVITPAIGDRTFYQARRRASRVAGELVARKMTTDQKSIVGYEFRRIAGTSGEIGVLGAYRRAGPISREAIRASVTGISRIHEQPAGD